MDRSVRVCRGCHANRAESFKNVQIENTLIMQDCEIYRLLKLHQQPFHMRPGYPAQYIPPIVVGKSPNPVGQIVNVCSRILLYVAQLLKSEKDAKDGCFRLV